MYQERGEGRSCQVFVPIFGNDCNSKEETLKKATLKSQDETYQLNSLFLQNLLNTCKNSRLLYLCTRHGFCKVRRYIHQYLRGKEESLYSGTYPNGIVTFHITQLWCILLLSLFERYLTSRCVLLQANLSLFAH